jgi:hypothetical protein
MVEVILFTQCIYHLTTTTRAGSGLADYHSIIHRPALVGYIYRPISESSQEITLAELQDGYGALYTLYGAVI